MVMLRWILIMIMSFINLSSAIAEPKMRLELSKDTVWQREQFIATLEVISDQKFARLEAEEFDQDEFYVVPLDLKKEQHGDKTHLSLRWILFAQHAENRLTKQSIKFPRVRYRPNTGRPKELKLPDRSVNIRPLPIYISPTMPVGRVSLSNEWKNGFIIPANKLFDWKLSATLINVSPQTLAAVSKYLKSTDNIQFFPPEKSIIQDFTKTGTYQKQNLLLPIKGRTMGRLELPQISVQFFDPEKGKLQTVDINLPTVWVLYPWMIWLGKLFLILLLIFTLIRIVPLIKKRLKLKNDIAHALKQLKKSTSYEELREAINLFLQTRGKNSNISLDQFASLYIEDANYMNIYELIKKLKKIQFSHKRNEQKEEMLISQISQQLYQQLK